MERFTKKAQSAGRPDGSAEAGQGRPTVSSEPWFGLKDFMKRVPMVHSLDLLSGGDKGEGNGKADVTDDRAKDATVLEETEVSEEPGLEELSDEEFVDADARSIQSVASTDMENPTTAEGTKPSLPTVADSLAKSPEERIEELKQQLEQVTKELRASISSKKVAFKRVNEKWERRASVDSTVSSTEMCTSDSLVIKLRSDVASLYGIQSVDGIPAMETEVSEEPGLEDLSDDTEEFLDADSRSSADVDEFLDADARSVRSVASTDMENRTTSDGTRLPLPTVADSPVQSSEKRLEELRLQLAHVAKEMKASIVMKKEGFKRIDKEWRGALKELRRTHKKSERFTKRKKKTMAKLQKQGYIDLLETAQVSSRRRRASIDETVSSTLTYTSDVSLVAELRSAVSSLYGIQSVDGISGMSRNTDQSSDARSVAVDGASAVSTNTDQGMLVTAPEVRTIDEEDVVNLDNLCYGLDLRTSRSVAADDGSDTTSLASFVTAVSQLTDQDDQQEETTVKELVGEMPLNIKKKSKLQRIKHWIVRKGRNICNKIRRHR
ncbi:Hypp7450 [Branchiostoma lanceolatum]|uniref:Hypp7450 protein n=1 Tax=Branchiostoma lanceolatum TaxID=7740 RepID=A0A8J9Z128_BRALA|nr:Hypp7450 [Branchiostoma lanceolatum]